MQILDMFVTFSYDLRILKSQVHSMHGSQDKKLFPYGNIGHFGIEMTEILIYENTINKCNDRSEIIINMKSESIFAALLIEHVPIGEHWEAPVQHVTQ